MTDYKTMTQELIMQNLTYVLTGCTTLLIIGIIASVYFGVDVHNLFVAKKSQSIVKQIVDDSVDYISPPANKNTPENGQISAIQTEQVTHKENKYIVQPGDTLRIISAQVYGDPDAYMPIMQANNLISPDIIEIGMELVIPR